MRRALGLCSAAIVALSVASASDAFAQGRKPKPKPPTTPPTGAAGNKPTPPATPKVVKVTVVEIAGGRAYIEPGTRGGVRQAGTVTIKGKEYKVSQASDSYAVIDLRDDSLHEKDEGRATASAEVVVEPPPPPAPLSTWEHAWTPEQAPALSQTPTFVPLGEAARDRRWDVRLGLLSGGIFPLGGQPGAQIGFVELDAKLHAEPFSVPAALDVDGSLRFYAAPDLSSRVGSSARSYLSVRELLAHYGSGGWYAGLGRMKYASSTLGTLDGLRVAAPLGGGFSIGAFGGLLPNPLSGALATDAQRFGIEARFSKPEAKLRPEAAIVVHGSTFNGGLDERRVSGMFGVYPGLSRFGGHVEVSNFDANNPWKASTVEVTSAGLDESIRVKNFDFGARFDLLQPERSRWLASYLPTSWFCRPVPTSGVAPNAEPCDGSSSTRLLGALDAGVTFGKASFGLGATTMGDVTHGTEPRTLGAFATARVARIGNVLRLEAAGSGSTSTYLDMLSASAGFGLTLVHDLIDFSAYYRRGEVRYAAVQSYLAQDGVGGSLVVFPMSTVMVAIHGEGVTGNDAAYLSLLANVVWRPRF